MSGVNRLDLDPETAIKLIETKIIEKLQIIEDEIHSYHQDNNSDTILPSNIILNTNFIKRQQSQ